VNKTELIANIAEEAALSKADATKALDAFLRVVENSLSAKESVAIVGFGIFDVRERPAREGRNPKTGEKIKIDAKALPIFKAGKLLKDAVAETDKK
jgi:DNA-binding protein HU-beta